MRAKAPREIRNRDWSAGFIAGFYDTEPRQILLKSQPVGHQNVFSCERPPLARNPGNDTPGCWHHVLNCCVAKRTLFEGEHGVRLFLSPLANAVRRGQIEVHAWSTLTPHLHSHLCEQ